MGLWLQSARHPEPRGTWFHFPGRPFPGLWNVLVALPTAHLPALCSSSEARLSRVRLGPFPECPSLVQALISCGASQIRLLCPHSVQLGPPVHPGTGPRVADVTAGLRQTVK